MIRPILIVDDEANHRLMLRLHLQEAGYRTAEAENGRAALELFDRETFAAIILDLQMEIMDGLTFLGALRRRGVTTPVVVVTAHSNVRTAVETMKLGATDFLSKPVDIEELLRILRGLTATPAAAAAPPPAPPYRFEGVWSEKGLGQILDLLAMVAPTDASVLVLGESGTGKELVARSIHANSPRRQGPFLAVSCAALTESLIESELFGHEKGAFTGAIAAKAGKFQLANGGTLFLDEIGEMPLGVQAKLLRAVQEKTFERVGGTRTLQADVRIVAATNRDLQQRVAEGQFREDLFFRLNVFPVRLPPLRERREEIPLLLRHFVDKCGPAFNKRIKGWSAGFLGRLMVYHFPGNIRELENLVERGIILTRGEMLEESVLPDLTVSVPTRDYRPVDLRENERQAILAALEQTGGNKSRAAELLGISRRALHYKINEYGI